MAEMRRAVGALAGMGVRLELPITPRAFLVVPLYKAGVVC